MPGADPSTRVEPGFASFLPQPERRLVAGLDPRQGILSESAAKLRHLGVGSTLTFSTGNDVTIVGTLPDVLMGSYELLVDRATARGIGVTHERYILFQVRPAAHPTAPELAQRFVPYLPIDVPYPVVEVRAPGETKYLRANDREAPPIVLKERFGEFQAQPDPIKAITDFRDQLARRGIDLIIMPVPVKPSIDGHKLSSAASGSEIEQSATPSGTTGAADDEHAGVQVPGARQSSDAPVSSNTRRSADQSTMETPAD